MNVDLHSLNVLSLCSGCGGFDRGVSMAVSSARTVCYVEIEAYACELLASLMEASQLDAAPVWTNLRTFDGVPWRGLVDLVIGGYPCQPFSLAGKRLGADDPRHLWPHIARILREVQPRLAFFENVPGHVSCGLRDVRCDLEEMGYRVEAVLIRASDVGAPHKRERLFIMANAGCERIYAGESRGIERKNGSDSPTASEVGSDMGAGDGFTLGNANDTRLEGWGVLECADSDERIPWPPSPTDDEGWRSWSGPVPAVRGDSPGIQPRLDRLRILGNTNPPQQYAYAFRVLASRFGLTMNNGGSK